MVWGLLEWAQEQNYADIRFKMDNIILKKGMDHYKWFQNLYPNRTVVNEDFTDINHENKTDVYSK